jgi:predicted nucleic acid-binding protein
MDNNVFLDIAYAIALASQSDKYHELAVKLADRLESKSTTLVTTRAVQLEIGNALSKQRFRDAGIQLLQSLEKDPTVEIIRLSESLYQEAFHLYSSRKDKEWGLVDCISFITMEKQNILEALTTDDHFRQAGFSVLLK